MGVGLTHTAKIEIALDFKDTAALTGFKAAMKKVVDALELQGVSQRFETLEATIGDLSHSLSQANSKVRELESSIRSQAADAVVAAAKTVAAVKNTATAVKEVANEEKATAVAFVSAEGKIVSSIKKRNALNKTATEGLRAGAAAFKALDAAASRGRLRATIEGIANETKNWAKGLQATATSQHSSFVKMQADSSKLATQWNKDFKQIDTDRAESAKIAQVSVKKILDADGGLLGSITKQITAIGKLAAARLKLNSAETKRGMSSKDWDQEYNALVNLREAQQENVRLQAQIIKELDREASGSSRLSKALRDLRVQISAVNTGYANSDRTLAAYATQVGATIEKERQHIAELKSSLKYRLTFYEQQMDAIFRASFRMQMVGNNLTQFARNIVMNVGTMMTTFGDFQYMMNRAAGAIEIWNDTLLDNKDGTQVLQTGILDLAADMKLLPAKDVAEALYYWGSATGVAIDSSQELATNLGSLEKIMQASLMTNTSYEQTIKGVYSILSQYYHGSVAAAGQVTEELFYITQKTAVEFTDLIQAFKMVGPIAAANNVSFEDMVTLFGRLGDLGIRGSQAGRAFRQMFIQILRPSGPAKKAIDQLFASVRMGVKEFQGKSYTELMFPKGEFVGTTGYLHNLALAVEQLNVSERNAFLGRIATANELPILTALIGDEIRKMHGLGSSVDKGLDLAGQSAEYFRKNWERLSTSWNATIGQLQRSWEALQIQIGSTVAKALEPLLNTVGDLLKKFRAWATDPSNSKIIEALTKIGGFAVAFAAIAGAVLTLTGTLMGLASVAYVVIKAFAPLIPAVTTVTGLFAALADGVVRNFAEIQSTIEYAFTTVAGSFNNGTDAMGNMMEILNDLINPMRTMVDILIKVSLWATRVAADIIHLTTSLGILQPVVQVVAGVIGSMIAAKTLAGFAGLMGRLTGIAGIMGVMSGKGRMGGALGIVGMMVGDTVAAARGVTSVGTAVSNLRTGASMLMTTLGPLGIAAAVLGIGTVAYQVFPPFHDFIDGITDMFRDLNKEIAETTNRLGDLGPQLKVDAATAAAAMSQRPGDLAVAGRFDTSTIDPQSGALVGPGGGPGAYMTMVLGKEYKSRDNTSLTNAIMDIIKQIEEDRPRIQAQLLTAIEDSSNKINDALANQHKTGVDPGIINAAILHVNRDMPVGSVDASRALVEAVMSQYGLAGSRTDISKVITDKLTEWGWTPGQIAQVLDKVVTQIYSPSGVQTAANDAASKIAQGVYGPVIDTLLKATSADQAREILTAPMMEYIGGGISVPIRDSLAMALTSLPEDTQQAIRDVMEKFGLQGDLEDTTAQTIGDYLGQEASRITDAVSLAGDRVYKETYNKFKPTIETLIEDLNDGSTAALTDAASQWMSLKDPLTNRAFRDDVNKALIQAGYKLAADGLIDIKTVKAVDKIIVDQTAKELADAADKANVEANKNFQDAVKNIFLTPYNAMIEMLSTAMTIGDTTRFRAAVARIAPVWKGIASEMQKGTTEGFVNAFADIKQIAPDFGRGLLPDALKGPILEAVDSLKATGLFSDTEIQTLVNSISPSAEAAGEKVAGKTRLDFFTSFVSGLDSHKSLKGAVKAGLKHGGLVHSLNQLLGDFTDPTMLRGLHGNAFARRAARAWVNSNATAMLDEWSSAGPKMQGRIERRLERWLRINYDDLPPETQHMLDPIITKILGNITIDGKTIGEGKDKVKGVIETVFSGIATADQGKSSKKNPIGVWIKVHTLGGKRVDTLVEKVNTAKTTITTAIDFISTKIDAITAHFGTASLSWGEIIRGGVDDVFNAGLSIAAALNRGMRVAIPLVRGTGNAVLNALSGLGWKAGGGNAGRAWAWAFNSAVQNSIKKTLTFVASVTIGNSPPKAGPLANIDVGGHKVGHAWGTALGDGAHKGLVTQARRIRNDLNSMSGSRGLGLSSESTVNNKKELAITLDVSSKDGTVDRAKQGEMRRGMMDMLTAADLEHFVTVG